MSKLVLLVVVSVVLAAVSVTAVSAKDVQPVMNQEQVIGLINRAYEAPGYKFLKPNEWQCGLRVVYVHEGVRYTFEHTWNGGIQIYLRPDGTSYPSVEADFMCDENSDGVCLQRQALHLRTQLDKGASDLLPAQGNKLSRCAG